MGTREYLLDKAKNEGLEAGVAQGMAQGIAQGKAEAEAKAAVEKRSIVRNLIVQTAFSNQEIANIVEVSESLVAEARVELSK